jgi:hypothetical protein
VRGTLTEFSSSLWCGIGTVYVNSANLLERHSTAILLNALYHTEYRGCGCCLYQVMASW